MAKSRQSLTKSPEQVCGSFDPRLSHLGKQTRRIHKPRNYFVGQHSENLLLPNDILLFHNHMAFGEVGGSAHHRHVLIVPVQTAGQVIVDQAVFDLSPGHAILISPWQFHRYANFQKQSLNWLFVTFELGDSGSLSLLRDMTIDLDESLLNMFEKLCENYLLIQTGQTRRIGTLRLQLALILQMLIECSQSNNSVPIHPNEKSLIS